MKQSTPQLHRTIKRLRIALAFSIVLYLSIIFIQSKYYVGRLIKREAVITNAIEYQSALKAVSMELGECRIDRDTANKVSSYLIGNAEKLAVTRRNHASCKRQLKEIKRRGVKK